MVVYTCNDEDCGRVFQQEPAYINHMMKHLNEGGEYLKDLTTKKKRKPKTPKPATAPVEKEKKTGDRRIETARVEWEKRPKRRRVETEAATALAAASSGKKNRGKRRRKVWQTIAAGRVGDGNGQGEVIDLRSPSRSPSIELIIPRVNTRTNFTLTPDTTVPPTSRNSSPGEGISDITIPFLHHLTASLASGSERNDTLFSTSNPTRTLGSTSKGASEETVVAHHRSAPTYPTPHASRETSEEAMIAHHQYSASRSPIPQTARGVSEEAIINHHNHSPIPQPTRGTSEEAVIIHHHSSPSLQAIRQASEEAVTAYHHMSVSMSPSPSVYRDTSEEAIFAHHHLSPTPTRSQVTQYNPNPSPISDRAVMEYHNLSPSRSYYTSQPIRQLKSTEVAGFIEPSVMGTKNAKIFKSDSLSLQTLGKSLLQPFAYPAITPVPSPPLSPTTKRSTLSDPFHSVAPQGDSLYMDAAVEYTAQDHMVDELCAPLTPPQRLSASAQAFDEVITPSRLGPSWKVETAPQSVIDEEEIDELESESGEDGDDLEIPRLSQLRLDSPLSFLPSLFQETTGTQQEQDIEMEGSSDSNAWALEYGIDPKQWDVILTESPNLINQGDLDTDDPSESHAGSDNAGEGSSGEEDDGDDTAEEDEEEAGEGECGYRVFAGWADIESMNSAQKEEQHQATTPGSSIKSFGSLTPRRPTAFEATTGGRYEQYLPSHRPNSASPGSSTGQVSAELDSPISPPSQAGGVSVTSGSSPSYLFDPRFHYESINSTPDRQRGSAAGENMPKRDQVILALLQAGHVTLAEDVLRGYTADTHGKQE